MKNTLLISLLLLTSFGINSCKDDPASVRLSFKATYEDAPLVFLQQYDYPDGKKIMFQQFNFFISEVTLVNEKNEEVELQSIDFLDFSNHTSLAEAEKPLVTEVKDVPAGNYKSLKISIGVPADQNNSGANQLAATNPLKVNFNSHYWSDWGSFIFMKSEGIYDKNGDGVLDGSDAGFGHHPGADASFRTLTFTAPISVKKGSSTDLNFELDILKLYLQNGVPLDLSNPANLSTQQLSDAPLMNYLMDNFADALTLK